MIYLARKARAGSELLRQLGVDFDELRLREAPGRDRDVVEEALDGEPAAHYVERIARTKATHRLEAHAAARAAAAAGARRRHRGRARRRDLRQAARRRATPRAMLRGSPGATHEVLTARRAALAGRRRRVRAVGVARHVPPALRDDEIERYVATGEPLDKAGAYAIQGRAAAFVTRIEGSYSGVMGLPLAETAELLAQAGIPVL